MSNTKRVSIDTKAILTADDQIWPKTVGPLARCLVAYMNALGPGAEILSALSGLSDDLNRIAAILYPEEFAKLREFYAWDAACRRPARPDKVSIPRALRKAVFDRDDYRCTSCGERFDLCADHKIPESQGGPTTLENLGTLCRRCNSRKGNRTEDLPGEI